MRYSVVGDDQASVYFNVGEENGEIRVRTNLKEDTANKYTVSRVLNCYLLMQMFLDKLLCLTLKLGPGMVK